MTKLVKAVRDEVINVVRNPAQYRKGLTAAVVAGTAVVAQVFGIDSTAWHVAEAVATVLGVVVVKNQPAA